MKNFKLFIVWILKILNAIGLIFTIININSIFDHISLPITFIITGNTIRLLLIIIFLFFFILSIKGSIPKINFDEIKWFDFFLKLNHVTSVPHKLTLVSHFALKGQNRRSKTINVIESYIQSQVTGEKLPVFINGEEVKNIIIQPKAFFSVNSPFPNNGGYIANDTIKGMTLESFRNKYSYFNFVFKTKKKIYTFKTDIKEVDEWIKSILLMNFPSPGEKKVLLKDDV